MNEKVPHSHSHEHHHHHHSSHGHHHHHAARNIGLAFIINASFCVIELIGGWLTGSVAIISDALHDFGDSLTLGFSYYLEKKSGKESDRHFSYGYRRLSLLSALFSGLVLIAGSLMVLAFAIPRLFDPVQPHTAGMLGLAVLGIAANGFAAWRVHKGETMNEKMISWHLLEDVLGWLLIMIISIVMSFVDLPALDPLLSILFTCFILWGVFKTFRSTVRLFLQAVPESLDLEKIRSDILKLKHVVDIHDVHVWSLDGRSHVLTMHVVVDQHLSLAALQELKKTVKSMVEGSGLIHATIEFETEEEYCAQEHCVGGAL